MLRRALLSLLVAEALLVVGVVAAVALGHAEEGSTATPPDISGVITRITASDTGVLLLVEDEPTQPSAGAKAAVRCDASTRWSGAPGTGGQVRLPLPAGVTLGTRVSVFFDGPVAASYPVQGHATLVVVTPPR